MSNSKNTEGGLTPNEANSDFLAEDLERAVELFSGREGISALEQVDEKGIRRFTLREEPLAAVDFHRHLKGEFSLGIYLMRANETVKFAVIDVDISRQVILKSPDKSAFAACKQDALTDVKQLISVARRENLPVTLEDSGNRGYHLWFFFTEPILAEQARRLLRWITRQCAPVSDHITREVFPKEKRMGNSNGSVIKLPLGIHSASGRRSLFLTHDGGVDSDQPGVLRSISMIELTFARSLPIRN